MARTIHYDPSTQTNSCTQCGRTTYGMSLSHTECPDCRTVELAQERNRLIEAEHQRRAKEREEEGTREYLRERAVRAASRREAGVSDPWSGFITAAVRLFVVFMLVSWLLPQKIEGLSMVLAIAIVLAVDRFQPDLSEFTTLSSTERLVHWVLLAGSIGSAIVG